MGSYEGFNRIQKKYYQVLVINSAAAYAIHQSLESARHGSIGHLTELANFWQEAPNLLKMGILDVFYAHLDVRKAPPTQDPAAGASAVANRAVMSLLGLSKAGTFIGDSSEYSGAIINAWPGIFVLHNWIGRFRCLG